MVKVFCDVCGKELPPEENNEGFLFDVGLDFCGECHTWLDNVNRSDLHDALLACFRQLKEQGPPLSIRPAPAPGSGAGGEEPASGIKGRYAPLKRAVVDALDVYRKEHGVGCWRRLAEAAGVTTEEIAQARAKRKLPMEVWEALARALGINQ